MSRQTNQIVLVDGNHVQARVIVSVLQRNGKEVRHFADGLEALAVIRSGMAANGHRPDVILVDVTSAGTAGWKVLADVKLDPDLRSIPVVVLTASQAPQAILEAYNLQANCCIVTTTAPEAFEKMLLSLERFWFGIAKLPTA